MMNPEFFELLKLRSQHERSKIMFGGLTKHIKGEVIGKAIEKLGKTGKASLDGVGTLKYDYNTDELTMVVDPEMKKKVRESYYHYHRKNVNYQ